jgi:hypothetical protein
VVADDLPVQMNKQTKVRELRELIERGEYRVDPTAVADAVIAHVSGENMAADYAQLMAARREARRRARIRGRSISSAHVRPVPLTAAAR